MIRSAILSSLLLASSSLLAAEITLLEADARMRQAYALARDANDQDVMDRIVAARDHLKKAFARDDVPAIKLILRDVETMVGLDAGGKTMHGMTVVQLTGRQRLDLEKLTTELNTAMAKEDLPTITATIKKMHQLLGEHAGVPDSRRKGEMVKAPILKADELPALFVKALQAEPKGLKALQEGVPNMVTMPRAYASVVLGCVPVRAIMPDSMKEQQAVLDQTIAGACKILLALQLPSGFFKFPDLRDKHVRFGAMIQAIVDKDVNAVQDGWVTLPDPEGETHYDVSECGLALLRAGILTKNDNWKQAGLKAATWMMKQPSCAMFHDNAYAISLLCEAYRVSNEPAFRESALKKYRLGLAVGQVESGRWIDPYNARLSSMLVILRGLHDLYEVLPAGMDRDDVQQAATKAMRSLHVEMDRLQAPLTSYTLQELIRHATLFPASANELQPHMEQAKALLLDRTIRGGRVLAAVPLPELAAVVTNHRK